MTELKNDFSWSKTRDEVLKTNFTKAPGENDAEDLLVIRDKRLASLYTKN